MFSESFQCKEKKQVCENDAKVLCKHVTGEADSLCFLSAASGDFALPGGLSGRARENDPRETVVGSLAWSIFHKQLSTAASLVLASRISMAIGGIEK
jgi:hypothetical protein